MGSQLQKVTTSAIFASVSWFYHPLPMPDIHIYYVSGSRVACVHAIKGYLPIMMGTIIQSMDKGEPLYSFETIDADPHLLRELLGAFQFYEVQIRIAEEHEGEEEDISEELLFNLIEQGREIAAQTRRDVAREAGEEE
jgi:hypothetical protein